MNPSITIAWIFTFLGLAFSLPASTTNLAVNGTASSSSTGFGGPPELAIDGNRDGNYANGSVFHSAGGTGPGEWFEVDLGAEFYLDRILLFPRTDQFQNSVRDFTLEIFDTGGNTVWPADFLPESSTGDCPWGTAAMSGQQGRRIRLTLKNPNASNLDFVTFAEFEVWGSTTPLPQNTASTASLTSSNPGFGAVITNGVDDDLASNFFANSEPDGPIFHDDPGPGQGFYRLEYDRPVTFGEVQLYNRVFRNAPTTTLAYRLSILDDQGGLITSQEVTAEATNYDHVLQFGDVVGTTLLIEELDADEFLAFSEIRVLETSGLPSTTPQITQLTRNPETGELTFEATVRPNTTYFLYGSANLENWAKLGDDILSTSETVTFTYTPPGNPSAQYFYLEEITPP